MESRTTQRIKKIAAGGVAALALALPVAAQAGPLVADAPNCATQALSQPFLNLRDRRVGIRCQKRRGGHQHAWDAEAALNGAVFEEGVL